MNDSALSQSVLYHTPAAVGFCPLFTHRVSGEVAAFCHLGSFPLSLFLSLCFWLFLTGPHTHMHTHTPHTHTHAAVSDHMHSYNTTGCCRVDVWGVKVHTSRDKQYLFLRTNYSLFIRLIDADICIFTFFSPLFLLLKHIDQVLHTIFLNYWLTAKASATHGPQTCFTLPLSFPADVCSDKTIRKQKDKQKDNHYFSVLLCVYNQRRDLSNWCCQSWAALLDARAVSLN